MDWIVVFAALIALAAWSLLRGRRRPDDGLRHNYSRGDFGGPETP